MSIKLTVKFGVALLVLAAAAPNSQAASCSLAGLGWMAGSWHNKANPSRAQERWAVAPDDVLMGSAWEFPQGKSGYAEVMTIRRDGDATSMFIRHFDGGLAKAWEERGAPMVFIASSCVRNSVIFEGQGDHVGEHISYKRSGSDLLIVGDFLHHGTPDHEEWHMVKAQE